VEPLSVILCLCVCSAGVSTCLHTFDQKKLPCQDFLSLVCLFLAPEGLSFIPTHPKGRGEQRCIPRSSFCHAHMDQSAFRVTRAGLSSCCSGDRQDNHRRTLQWAFNGWTFYSFTQTAPFGFVFLLSTITVATIFYQYICPRKCVVSKKLKPPSLSIKGHV
jgi:hypothetical protein